MTFASLVGTVTNIVLLVVPIVGSIVLIAFFWNLATLLFNVSDAEKMKQAKQRIIWAIITMFVLFTVGGIVALLGNSFFGGGGTGTGSSGFNVGSGAGSGIGSGFGSGFFGSGGGTGSGSGSGTFGGSGSDSGSGSGSGSSGYVPYDRELAGPPDQFFFAP